MGRDPWSPRPPRWRGDCASCPRPWSERGCRSPACLRERGWSYRGRWCAWGSWVLPGNGVLHQRYVLMGAVHIALDEGARAQRPSRGDLHRMGWIELDDLQHVLGHDAVEARDGHAVESLQGLEALVGRAVGKHNVEGEQERASVLARDERCDLTDGAWHGAPWHHQALGLSRLRLICAAAR